MRSYVKLEDVAEERGESPAKIGRTLVRNGCDLYLHFGEARKSRAGVSFYPDHPTLRMEHNIGTGDHPLTKDSQEAVIKRLGRVDTTTVGLMVLVYWNLDATEQVEYQIELMEQDNTVCVVVDSEDLKFLPPLPAYQDGAVTGIPTVPENNFFENFEDIITYGKREPHSAFTVVARTKMKMKRADAWHQLTQLASKSNGQVEVKLPGWGFIYLKRDKLDIDKQIRHKSTIFESPNDGDAITKNAFNTAWQRATQH